MSTGFLLGTIWVEAPDTPPPRSPLRQPRQAGEIDPTQSWQLPGGGAYGVAFLSQDQPRPRPHLRQPRLPGDLPVEGWSTPVDVAVAIAWADPCHQRPPAPPPRPIRPAAPADPPEPPSLVDVGTVTAWQPQSPPTRRPPAGPRPAPPDGLSWARQTAGQGEPGLAFTAWTETARRPAAPTRQPAAPQDVLPPLYGTEAVALVDVPRAESYPTRRPPAGPRPLPGDGPPAQAAAETAAALAWFRGQETPPQQPRPRRPGETPQPVAVPWIADVALWAAPQLSQAVPVPGRPLPRRPQPDLVPGSVLFAAAGLNVDVLQGPLSVQTAQPPRRPPVQAPAVAPSEPYIQLASPVPWLAPTDSPQLPRTPPRGPARLWQPPSEQLWSVLWVVPGPYRAWAASVYTAGAVEADIADAT